MKPVAVKKHPGQKISTHQSLDEQGSCPFLTQTESSALERVFQVTKNVTGLMPARLSQYSTIGYLSLNQ
jgi:hypothetical protein